MNSLEELRQWHYDRCATFRRLSITKYSRSADLTVSAAQNARLVAQAKAHERTANMHIKAVQLLNDVCTGNVK